jgi:hypothetical protein
VRYADYRGREEKFGVRISQAGKKSEHVFGAAPRVDELDPMKLYWDWSFAWDSTEMPLDEGAAHIEVFTPGPTQARRVVDCFCLTTDHGYFPSGREKPDFAAWKKLRQLAGSSGVELWSGLPAAAMPDPWRVRHDRPAFVWNVGPAWSEALQQSPPFEAPFGVDPPLVNDFLAAYRQSPKGPPIFGDELSGPVWHVPEYPKVFAPGSAFVGWLERHPSRPFAILLNYGDPAWPAETTPETKAATAAVLRRFDERFVGWIAGESLSHTGYDAAKFESKVRAAKSRADVLAAWREVHTESVVKKFSSYFGHDVSGAEAWSHVIPCLSANMESLCHAVAEWGVRRIGHENTGNSPTLGRRLAFLRGAARQFGCEFADYQSCNLGDAATMFSRQHYFYPASSRYIIDNSYDAFAGAGVNWLWKDYVLFHLAGVRAFYNEQGIDLFWKPGGNAAGDDAPVQLSPKGKVAEAALRLVREHPRGTPWTPVAFLIDEAHGWAQERFQPGAFSIDPAWNPPVLAPGVHEAALRAWFDVAYFPAPETQNRPAFGGGQTFVNGIFGDIFDVLVTAPGRSTILPAYRVIIAAGDIPLSTEWGRALRSYMETGGTLVVCDGSFSGAGVAELDLPPVSGEARTFDAFKWSQTREEVPSQVFRAWAISARASDRVLATVDNDQAVAILAPRGAGRLIFIGVPLGLGVDERPIPLLGLLMRALVEGLTPVRVHGDIEWTINRLDDGRWLIGMLNNAGIDKPQHGIIPTRHEENRRVDIRAAFPVRAATELLTNHSIPPADLHLDVPAGAVRLVRLEPE